MRLAQFFMRIRHHTYVLCNVFGSADLIEDVSAYKNYLMAGSYIRPFTVEFAAHINF